MKVAKVRLRKPTRVLTFSCNDDIELRRCDACIVKTDRGQEYGICVVPASPCSEEEGESNKLSVVRIATDKDNQEFQTLLNDEQQAKEVCRVKIAKRGLPMKLVDAEYTFDRRKITFYFTADERVDFRELVRDLAHELKARIELCHIQVRDEAKLVGGLGPCGQVLCCKRWMGDFMPISMKMAKRQNLSLNPEKISGQCGRLMCCLSYENDQYDDPRKIKKRRQTEQQSVREDDKKAEPALESPKAEEPKPPSEKSQKASDEKPKKRRRRRKRKKPASQAPSGGGQNQSGGGDNS